MNRRDFFRVIAAIYASTVIPSLETRIISPIEIIPAGFEELGLIREMICYEIYSDMCLIRHDILCTSDQ